MSVVTMKSLLESGVHFGHQTRRWNPKMNEYIYTSRGGIHIIDLQKTSRCLDKAHEYVRSISKSGGKILFVGTKKQAREAIKDEATRCGECYVNNRWLGGTLTNFGTLRKRVNRLKQLIAMSRDGTFNLLPKKEVIGHETEIKKLEKFLGGIKEMNNLPEVLFIIDPKKDVNTLLEAKKLKITVVGVVDTNCDPTLIDFPIPANDDAIRSVKLICSTMANAVLEGKEGDNMGERLDIDLEATFSKLSNENIEDVSKKTDVVSKDELLINSDSVDEDEVPFL